LIEIINELTLFPIFLKRLYEKVDSSSYQTLVLYSKERTQINNDFISIIKKLNLLKSDYSQETLAEIIHVLSKIQQYRFIAISKLHGESFFYHLNTPKNKIRKECVDLNSLRNKNEHEIIYQNWRKQLDLKQINTHLKTVYEGLIFDK
jgi:hypothetical protein